MKVWNQSSHPENPGGKNGNSNFWKKYLRLEDQYWVNQFRSIGFEVLGRWYWWGSSEHKVEGPSLFQLKFRAIANSASKKKKMITSTTSNCDNTLMFPDTSITHQQMQISIPLLALDSNPLLTHGNGDHQLTHSPLSPIFVQDSPIREDYTSDSSPTLVPNSPSSPALRTLESLENVESYPINSLLKWDEAWLYSLVEHYQSDITYA